MHSCSIMQSKKESTFKRCPCQINVWSKTWSKWFGQEGILQWRFCTPVFFFLFCIGLDELVELGDFSRNQSGMTEGYWKLFNTQNRSFTLWLIKSGPCWLTKLPENPWSEAISQEFHKTILENNNCIVETVTHTKYLKEIFI